MRMRTVVAATAAALAAGGLSAVTAQGTRPATTEAFTLKEVTTQFYFGETPAYPRAPGRGAGNEIFFTGDLLRGGRRAGINRGQCTTVADTNSRVLNPEGPGTGVPTPTPDQPPRNVAMCTQTLELDGDRIQAQGLLDQTGFEGDCAQRLTEQFCAGTTETISIVGGTGRYAGATGTIRLTQVEYPDVIRLQVTLRRAR